MAPRGGNDRSDAAAEIETQYGVGHQSAADLLDTHDANYDLVLQQALSKAVDEPATAALDADDIKPAFGGTVESFAVRGGRLVVVELTEEGRYVKWHKDVPSAAKSASKKSAVAGAVPPTQQVKAQTATGDPGAGDTPPAPPAETPPATTGDGDPGTGDDGTGDGDGDDSKAPKNVTVEAIRSQLAEEDTVPPREVRKKDDLWDLVTPEGQSKLVEAAGPES